MELTGAQIVVQSLKDEGVELVFGYPGGAALHIYDAFYSQEDVRHILVRHEQAATQSTTAPWGKRGGNRMSSHDACRGSPQGKKR